MLVQVESELLTFLGNAEGAGGVDRKHQDHGHREGGKSDDRAADELCLEQCEAAAVEKTCERSGVIGTRGTGGAELAGSKEASMKRSI